MNTFLRLGWFAACAILPACSSAAVTANDGTTIDNLIQFSNSQGAGGALDTLNVDAQGFLVATQSGYWGDFPLRTVWYADEVVPTGGVYTVSADFQPAADYFANRGGVMGWLSLTTSNGIALQVSPNDTLASVTAFRVSVIDFSADNGDDNDSFNHLFTTNGLAATNDIGTVLSAADPNYSLTNFATFQLAFSAPSAGDIAALSNATAHVTARVFQGTNAGAPVQVSQTIELLTDLPLAESAVHRFGYFAVWSSEIEAGDVIGSLDNLKVEGAIGLPPPNMLPAVSISSPTNGASFAEGDNISITANATDSDGTVVRVDFFAGTTALGTATKGPFSLTWSNVAAGNYSLTAKATDNRAGSATSAPVSIIVTGSMVGAPTLAIVRTGDSVEISWPTTGYQLQTTTNFASQSWADLPTNTVNLTAVTLPATAANMFFRLVQAGAPAGGPGLTIQQSGDSVLISWPSQPSGYRLQAEDSLSNSWTDVIAANNPYTEALTNHVARFYRLVSGP